MQPVVALAAESNILRAQRSHAKIGLMSQPFQSLRLSCLLLNLTTKLIVLYSRQHLSDFLPLIIHLPSDFLCSSSFCCFSWKLAKPSHQLYRGLGQITLSSTSLVRLQHRCDAQYPSGFLPFYPKGSGVASLPTMSGQHPHEALMESRPGYLGACVTHQQHHDRPPRCACAPMRERLDQRSLRDQRP
ncbi:hypothetical protein EDB85DRAFT_2006179 [Lactarius pseudohatsudake]|nr:hypothetical protein EDB85DRAFT_2006179 [Lactarius pseudohatsudake]